MSGRIRSRGRTPLGVTPTIVFNASMVYAPFVNELLRTATFPAKWWLFMLLGFPIGFLIPELDKGVGRRWRRKPADATGSHLVPEGGRY